MSRLSTSRLLALSEQLSERERELIRDVAKLRLACHRQLAALLGCSSAHVYKLCEQGKLPHFRDLHNAITQLRAEVATLKKFSFLIGMTDPYIVIPGAFTHGHDAAKTGDYALVIFGDGVYPAIVGDIGPLPAHARITVPRGMVPVKPGPTALIRPATRQGRA